jgi:hypothetical protein
VEELPVEGDRPLIEQRADHLDALDDPRERLGPLPVDAVLGEKAEVAARQHDLGAAPGQLVQGRRGLRDERRLTQDDAGVLGPNRMFVVCWAAAANSSHMSLCHVSSAA